MYSHLPGQSAYQLLGLAFYFNSGLMDDPRLREHVGRARADFSRFNGTPFRAIGLFPDHLLTDKLETENILF